MVACVDILLIGVNPCSPPTYRDAHSRTGACTRSPPLPGSPPSISCRFAGEVMDSRHQGFQKLRSSIVCLIQFRTRFFGVGSHRSTCPINSSSGGIEHPAMLDGFPLLFFSPNFYGPSLTRSPKRPKNREPYRAPPGCSGDAQILTSGPHTQCVIYIIR